MKILNKLSFLMLLIGSAILLHGCGKYMSLCLDPMKEACGKPVIVTPEVLEDAVCGIDYSAIITISGGPMPGSDRLLAKIIPPDSGISLRPVEEGWYNVLELYGKPLHCNEITIELSGYVNSIPAKKFQKEYKIIVRKK